MMYRFNSKLRYVLEIIGAGRKTTTVLIIAFLILGSINFVYAGASDPLKAAGLEKTATEDKPSCEKGKAAVADVNQSAAKPAQSKNTTAPKDTKAAAQPSLKNETGPNAAPEKSPQNKPVDAPAKTKAPQVQNTRIPSQPVQTVVKVPKPNQGQSNQDSNSELKAATGHQQDKSKAGQKAEAASSKVPLQEKTNIETKQGSLEGIPAKADVKQSAVKPAPSETSAQKDTKAQPLVKSSEKKNPAKNTAAEQIPNTKPAAISPPPAKQKPVQPDPPALDATKTIQARSNQNSKPEAMPTVPERQVKTVPAQLQQSSGAIPNQGSANNVMQVPATLPTVNGINPGTAPGSPQPSAMVPLRPINPAVASANQPLPAPIRPQRIFQPQPKPQQGKVTLNFDDADIYSVIQTVFGEILRVSYTVDPKIKGRVTFRAVAPVDVDKVLPLMEVIFRLNGIAIVEESGLNRLVPLSDIAREPVPVSYGRTIETVTGKSILKVVPIKNMQSTEMVKVLTPFSSEKAVIVNVPNTNQIIIVDTDSTVKRLIQLIEIFDTELQKPRGARVYVHHIQNGSAREITALLQNLFLGASIADRSHPKVPIPLPQVPGMLPPKTGTAPGSSYSGPAVTRGMDAVLEQARIVADENANTVIVYATPEEYEAIKDAIEKIDVTPRQVLIEALILDVLLTDNLSLGVNAAYKTKDLRIGFNAASTSITNDNVNSALSAVTKGLSIFKMAGNSDLSLFITALAEKSKMKVLSAPHTIVSDSKEAEITIADTVQITSADIVGTSTVQNTTLYQQKDVGTILKVTPRIHEGGMVALKVSQEVSQVAGDISNVKQGTLFHKTQVKNELVAMDGETIIIGGLIREDSTRSRNGIPFLSSIPLLGWLFGGTIDNVQRRELIILLTPRVIKNQKDASRLTEEYINRLIQGTKTGMSKDDITKQLPVIKPKGPDISQNRPDPKQQK